jgi:hypothetical protein
MGRQAARVCGFAPYLEAFERGPDFAAPARCALFRLLREDSERSGARFCRRSLARERVRTRALHCKLCLELFFNRFTFLLLCSVSLQFFRCRSSGDASRLELLFEHGLLPFHAERFLPGPIHFGSSCIALRLERFHSCDNTGLYFAGFLTQIIVLG